MKKIISSLIIFTLCIGMTGCSTPENTSDHIILATTTSTENSGLLDYILPYFTEQSGVDVKVIAVGTGKALQMGRDGEADVLLVHAKPSETLFVEEGHGLKRFDVMYNDFVVLGPVENQFEGDRSSIKVKDAFKNINESKAVFVSRGDDSGTHKKEKSIWESVNIQPSGDQYVSAGKGMGEVITMADELNGYTLSDRATFLSMSQNISLMVCVEGDPNLFNQYGVIAVNPDKNEHINSVGAEQFVTWLLDEQAQNLINTFGEEEHGQALFIANAKE